MHVLSRLRTDLHGVGAADDGEGHAGLEGGVLRLEVVVLVGVAVGELVDLDVLGLDLRVDRRLQLLHLRHLRISGYVSLVL